MPIRVRCLTCESLGENPFGQLTPDGAPGVIDYQNREAEMRKARANDEAHRMMVAQGLWEGIWRIPLAVARDKRLVSENFDPLEYFRGLVSHALVIEPM